MKWTDRYFFPDYVFGIFLIFNAGWGVYESNLLAVTGWTVALIVLGSFLSTKKKLAEVSVLLNHLADQCEQGHQITVSREVSRKF